MSRPSFRNLLLLLCLLVPLAGCGKDAQPQAPLETVLDLTAGLDVAEIEREPGLVDVGTPEARAWLHKGWSWDETDGKRTFVWSDGPESEVELFLASPRDVPLTLRGTPYPAPGAPPQEVMLVLNGEAAGRVTIAPGGAQESRVVLPERLLRAGTNRLVLRYAWTRSPWKETGGRETDHRHLAVAWDLLRFETGVDEQGRVRAAGGQLAIPFGWRVTTYLRLPAGAVLSWDDLRSRDGQPGELWVTVRTEDGKEDRDAFRFDLNSGPARVELEEADGTEPIRISLAAVLGERGGPAGGGLVLRRPAFQAPRTAPPPAPAAPVQATPAALRTTTGGRPRNVIIYLVDTLRADHLGCYGYDRPVSPRIDAFAREATLFRHTVAQSSWTRPSVATVLTGLLPRTHGVHRKKDALAPEAVTLGEILQSQGYQTAGFATNVNVAPSFGFAQGFDVYDVLGRRRNIATNIHARAVEWLEGEWKRDVPFFLYLHTVEPHAPYSPPEPFRRRFAPQVRDEAMTRLRFLRQVQEGRVPVTPELIRDFLDLYDAEIATNDAAFGALIDLLVERGLWQDTVVVFVSDHGEEFFEHGRWEHGKTLHTEMLDIPLIVRIPGVGNGRSVDRQAQHADVVPTILDALGIPIPAAVEGRSLLPWMTGSAGEEDTEEAAFSWLDEYGFRTASVTTPDWRLIEERVPSSVRTLYDRRSDPQEKRDVAVSRPVRAGYLGAKLKAGERPGKGALKAREGVVDDEMRRQLQALGYAH